MILGIGADDVFILYDAWLQSAHVEGIKDSRGRWNENHWILGRIIGISWGYRGDVMGETTRGSSTDQEEIPEMVVLCNRMQ